MSIHSQVLVLHKTAINWDFALRTNRSPAWLDWRKQGREWRRMCLEREVGARHCKVQSLGINSLCLILHVVRSHDKVLSAGWRIECGRLMVGNSENKENS